MSQVKRFVATCDCMSEADWGDYVRHSDYAALEADRDALLGSLESLVMLINADCCLDKSTMAAELLIAKCRGAEE